MRVRAWVVGMLRERRLSCFRHAFQVIRIIVIIEDKITRKKYELSLRNREISQSGGARMWTVKHETYYIIGTCSI